MTTTENENPTLANLEELLVELGEAEQRVAELTNQRNRMVYRLLDSHGAPTIGKVMGMTPNGIYHIRNRSNQSA